MCLAKIEIQHVTPSSGIKIGWKVCVVTGDGKLHNPYPGTTTVTFFYQVNVWAPDMCTKQLVATNKQGHYLTGFHIYTNKEDGIHSLDYFQGQGAYGWKYVLRKVEYDNVTAEGEDSNGGYTIVARRIKVLPHVSNHSEWKV